MSDVAVITAIYDSYDTIKPIQAQAGIDVEWILVTEDPTTAHVAERKGYRAVVEQQPGLHPNRAAKGPKLFPWKYTDAPMSIWVDASFRVVSETFAVEAIGRACPIAQFKHPWRDCIYSEAKASADIPKYRNEPILGQGARYLAFGHPKEWGLWATGVIARQHTQEVHNLSAEWAHEISRWSFQDQISQPFALRRAGLRPGEFPGSHLNNNWLVYEGSGRH